MGASPDEKKHLKPEVEDGIIYERIKLAENSSKQLTDNRHGASVSLPIDNKAGSDLNSVWRSIVARVVERKPSIGSYIEQGVPKGVLDGILTIGFNGGASVFINLLDRKDSKDFILEVVKGYIQGVSGIMFSEGSNKNENSPAPACDEFVASTHEKQQKEVEEAFSDPIVQEAIDILGGELVELRSRKAE